MCILPPAAATELNVELGGIVISDHTLASLLLGGGVSLRKSNVTTARNHCQFKETQKRGLIREECTSLRDCFKNTSSDSLKRRVTLHTSKGCEAIETWRPESYVNWNCYGRAVTLLVVFGDKEVGWAWYSSPVFTCRMCFMLASSLFFVFFPFFRFIRLSEKSDISEVLFQQRGTDKLFFHWHVDFLF